MKKFHTAPAATSADTIELLLGCGVTYYLRISVDALHISSVLTLGYLINVGVRVLIFCMGNLTKNMFMSFKSEF